MELESEVRFVEIKDVTPGISCMECGKWYKNHTQLKSHMWRHTGEKPFSCLVCSHRFTQQGNLKAHMRIHTGEKPFSCIEPGCHAKFTQRSNLKAHLKIHTGEKPFKCGYCSSAFRQATNLRTHRAIHTGERPYKCDICSKAFTQKSNLKAHKDRVHRAYKKTINDSVTLSLQDDGFYNNLNILYTKNEPDSFSVNQQNEIIVESDTMDYSMEPTVEILIPEEIMTKEEPFEFPCIKEEPNLNIEVVEGNIEDPYNCKICNNTYLSARDLIIHQCTKGLKYFQCDLCKDSLQSLADLKNHQASHSEGKKYFCCLCGLIFSNQEKLKLHHKLHICMRAAYTKKVKKYCILKTRIFNRKPKCNGAIKQTAIKKVTRHFVRSILNFNDNSKKVSVFNIGRMKLKVFDHSVKDDQPILRKPELSHRSVRFSLCQHYAVAYKYFLLLQRNLISKQNLKHQIDNTFATVKSIKDNMERTIQITNRQDKYPVVSYSEKKCNDPPLFMCSECKAYFTSLENIKSHMEIHRKGNNGQAGFFNSKNVLVISACLKYDEPMAQISSN